ncbi:MAG: redoxin domain-containing protein [Deltaproteobacteria bacterium]|nr:MAG: redoxin domain-containing protein [Deltaproteobacteria bacterium]
MRSDISPGGTFPDYELPDHTSTPRKLSELQGEDPLILTLARGHYCPKEHQQHLQLAAFYPQVAVAYTQMVTISTDDHHTLQEFRASVGAQWTFLSDPERTIQRDLEIQEYTDPEHNPMIPHTLVLGGKEGKWRALRDASSRSTSGDRVRSSSTAARFGAPSGSLPSSVGLPPEA